MLKQLLSKHLVNSHSLRMLLKPQLLPFSSKFKLQSVPQLLRQKPLTNLLQMLLSSLARRLQQQESSKVKVTHYLLKQLMVCSVKKHSRSLKTLQTLFMLKGFRQMPLRERSLIFLGHLQDLNQSDQFQGINLQTLKQSKLNLRLKVKNSSLFSINLKT